MKLSKLVALFGGQLGLAAFRKETSAEFAAYKNALSKKGSSVPITLTEDARLVFGGKELEFLCLSFLAGELDPTEAAYLADALLLASCVEFENEQIQEGLESFTDTDSESYPTAEDVAAIISRLT